MKEDLIVVNINTYYPANSAIEDESNDVFDQFVEYFVQTTTEQQGLHFKSPEDEKAHTERTTKTVRHLFGQTNALLAEGLKYLIESNTGFVREVAENLLAHLYSPLEIIKIIESEIHQQESALELFSEAVNEFYDCGDFHQEQCVISVFLMLFPLHPQPYACFGTLVWRKEGINEAKTFYDQIVDHLDEPVLDFYAAHCFYVAGSLGRAKELLERALSKIPSPPTGDFKDLLKSIRFLLKKCS